MSKERKTKQVYRFAHPFYTLEPPEKRKAIPGIGRQLIDHTKGTLHTVPRTRGKEIMQLADIVGSKGASEIETEGKIVFHSVGDTGRKPDSPEQMVADAMSKDFDIKNPGKSPAFFFHLGDVIYGPDKVSHTDGNSMSRTCIIPARSWRYQATMTVKFIPRPTHYR